MKCETREEIDRRNKKKMMELYDSLPVNKKDKLMKLLSSIEYLLITKNDL